MQTNNHEIHDYSAILDKKYGKEGTTQRKAFEDVANALGWWESWGMTPQEAEKIFLAAGKKRIS